TPKHQDPFDHFDDMEDEFVSDYRPQGTPAADTYDLDEPFAAPYSEDTELVRDPFADEDDLPPSPVQRQAFAAPSASPFAPEPPAGLTAPAHMPGLGSGHSAFVSDED